tara:strand:+ start:413 stop:1231 length:819 start_codon:yes stop_codon:yes gene_type:complete
MKYKYIIGSGCSFSDSHEPWLNSFNIETKWNLSVGGCGNRYIQYSVIKQVLHLLEHDVSVDDILVGVQFTGLARLDFIASEETPTPNDSLEDFGFATGGGVTDIGKGSAWIHSGGSNSFVRDLIKPIFHERYFLNYYKYFMTHTENWYNFLFYIITLQSFLKSNNIKYFFHTGWNLVDHWDEPTRSFQSNFLKFKQFDYLWNQIDHDRFIFYESNYRNHSPNTSEDYSKYGGMWQYLIERDGINLDNDHPSEYGHKIWGDYLKEQAMSRNII